MRYFGWMKKIMAIEISAVRMNKPQLVNLVISSTTDLKLLFRSYAKYTAMKVARMIRTFTNMAQSIA